MKIKTFIGITLITVAMVPVLFLLNYSEYNKRKLFEHVPMRSVLNTDVLKQSARIIPNDTDLVLTYVIDHHNIDLYNDPYLLFYNRNLNLSDACFSPFSFVFSIKDKTITGYLIGVSGKPDENRIPTKADDAPLKYHFRFADTLRQGWERRSNKLVEKIRVDSGFKITLFVKKSRNVYEGLKLDRPEDSFRVDSFVTPDTLSFPISALSFSYESNLIVDEHIIYKNFFLCDQMIVTNKKILDQFYDEVWTLLQGRKQKLNRNF